MINLCSRQPSPDEVVTRVLDRRRQYGRRVWVLSRLRSADTELV